MADLEDVEDALKAIVVGAIYPNGVGQPSVALNGATPIPCAVMTGWPTPDQLKRDHANGVQVISIFTPPQGNRNTTRLPDDWIDLTTPDPTVTVTIATVNATIGGVVQSPQNVCLNVNGRAYVYAVQDEDTLDDIAAGLAALISVDTPATSLGAVVTIPAAYLLTSAVGVEGTVARVIRQQEQLFDITVWCSSPELRKALAKFVDGAMAGRGLEHPRQFLAMPDGSVARILYRGTRKSDLGSQQGVYRRDLIYAVDYATIDTDTVAQVVAPSANYNQ